MSDTTVFCHQISMEFNIKTFSSTTNDGLSSGTFALSNANWYLLFSSTTSRILSLSLCKWASTSDRYRVAVTVLIKASGSMHIQRSGVFEFGSEETLINILSEDLCNVLSPDGSLTTVCTVRLVDDDLLAETATQTPPGGTNTLLEKRSNFVEIDPISFHKFLQYLHFGNEEYLTYEKASDLYLSAVKYNNEELKERCVWSMCHGMTTDSFCDVALVAYLHNESHLLNIATEFCQQNYETIVQTQQWQTEKWQTFLLDHIFSGNELLFKMLNRIVFNHKLFETDIII